MARDIPAYLRELEQRGYDVARSGGGHAVVRWKGARVSTTSVTRPGGRALGNLKSQVRRFERGRDSRG